MLLAKQAWYTFRTPIDGKIISRKSPNHQNHKWNFTGITRVIPGEFPAQKPVTRSFDIFLDLHLNKRLSKQWWGWWFETQSCSLWRHRNEVGTWQNYPRCNDKTPLTLTCYRFIRNSKQVCNYSDDQLHIWRDSTTKQLAIRDIAWKQKFQLVDRLHLWGDVKSSKRLFSPYSSE